MSVDGSLLGIGVTMALWGAVISAQLRRIADLLEQLIKSEPKR